MGQPSETLSTVATMGVIVLMFAVGLETRPSELFKVGVRAMIVGFVGIVLPMIAGFYFGKALGFGTPEAIFIGTALVATSVGITARVLADRGFLSTTEARIILAAAVIDDVLGMLVLSFAIGSSRGDFDLTQMGILVVQVVLFLGFELWLAPIIVKRHGHWLDRLKIPNAGFVVALIVLLSMAALSEAIGLAGIVGAFFAGMMFAETEDRWELSRQTRPLYEWLVPYFFVVTGMQVQPSLFKSPAVLDPGPGPGRSRRADQGGRLRVGCLGHGLEAHGGDRRRHGAARRGRPDHRRDRPVDEGHRRRVVRDDHPGGRADHRHRAAAARDRVPVGHRRDSAPGRHRHRRGHRLGELRYTASSSGSENWLLYRSA